MIRNLNARFVAAAALAFGLAVAAAAHADATLLNVSYDPTRELYQEFNAAFAKHWQAKTGEKVTDQAVARRLGQAGAHASSTVSTPTSSRWRSPTTSTRSPRRPSCCRPTGRSGCRNNSTPYTSTIVFLVRKGNPKGDQGLGRPGQARRRR